MSKTLLKHPRVVWVDDDRHHGGGWFVTLANGWAFDDPADTLEEDPHGNSACHCHSFRTVAEALERIRTASPCKCGRCLGPTLQPD